MESPDNIINIDVEKDIVDETTDTAIAQELVDQIQSMADDRDNKCKAAKEQLIEMLKITADKYRTATGPMEALRVMRMVCDGRPSDMEIFDELEQARNLAADMVHEVNKLVQKAEKLGYMEMDQLCKDAYTENFIKNGFSAIDLCFELMRIDLCRNVGPSAEDMVEFQKRVQEEINATQAKLDEMIKDNPEFAKLTPTSKE